ncbi:MAG: SPOR domain-containing protein [Candidatus Eisenbacteria bacterium]|nr:SPOR domain-containing protein [Candidatus Eisenbacteria bacterium]
MTDPNKPDQKPAGQEPAEAPTPPSGAYLSPKLREKLEGAKETDADWEPKKGSPLPALITTVVIVAVAIGGFMWWRSSAEKQKAHEAAVATARADSLAAAARADSLAVAARADSLARAAADSLARQKALLAAGPPAPHGYGIAVGTFLVEERAKSERDRLSAATGLPGIVAPTAEGGSTSYRVILGRFDSRSVTESKAASLLESNRVSEALVVMRPK